MEVKGLKTPTNPFALMKQCYQNVFPAVNQELAYWQQRALQIPDHELKRQALASIHNKRFHCEGGAIFSLLAETNTADILSFIVSYQTISDYLDNLCDRSNSLDPKDFRALHEAMEDALNPDAALRNYYRYRANQNDGGYLHALVTNCQRVLRNHENYALIRPYLIELCQFYCDLQVHKHVTKEERVPRLKNWFQQYQRRFPDLYWYEFAACSGSTLGIFCLVATSCRHDFQARDAEKIYSGYFPYLQGLHIMLDYLIDQEEDRQGGDLNFCFYYPDEAVLLERLKMFVEKADDYTNQVPQREFHKLIHRGLLGLYLSDTKVTMQPDVHEIGRHLVKMGGNISIFFYLNGKVYRKWRNYLLSRNSKEQIH